MKNKILLALLLTILAVGLQAKFMRLSAQPSVDFTFTGICVNSPTTFSVNTAVTNVGVVTNWNWDFGDGTFSNQQNPTYTYAGPGTYTVILTITDTSGAVGSATHYVTIEPLPIPNFSYNTPNCQNEPVQFLNLSSTLYGYIKTWIWNFGDGSPVDTINFPVDPNVTHVFPTFGTFNVTLTVINSDSCTNTVSLPVVVTPGPIANFYSTGKCEDQVVQFNDASFSNGAGNVVSWAWDFGDPTSGINNTSNLTNPTHIFSNPGTYNVCLIIVNFNNCKDTMCKQVLVYPHPPVDFTYTNACLNQLIYFDPDPLITNINAIGNWLWDFGDGITSTARNTAHNYIAAGTYTVQLTVTDTAGCINTVSHSITIHPLPVPHFDAGTTNCAGATVHFNELSSTVFGYIIKWVWNFGDGTTDTVFHPGDPNVNHVYPNPGTYNVTLTITASDSCTNFETQVITIHPNPVANFVFGVTCFGTPVDFTDISQNNGGGSLVLWNWDFGDPSTGVANFSTLQNPSHMYSDTGTFVVSLVVATSNGCSDTIQYNVTVKPKPAVDFTTQNNCQNNAVLFIPNPAVMNIPSITSWNWNFGDGVTSTLTSPTHTYTISGTYNVTLTVSNTNGCSNTIIKPVVIIPQPISNFDYSQPACKGSDVQFFSLASANPGYIVQWIWNFGDGNNTTIGFQGNPNVLHTYGNYGTFNVTLTVKTNDSCTKSFTKPITVAPNPLANFSFQTTCINSPVQFNDLSQAGGGSISDWQWNFGEPASGSNNQSTLQNPQHTFSAPITYIVSLIVTNSGGCKDTILIPVPIHGLPGVDFTSSAGCVNDSTHFASSPFVDSLAVVTREWDFGDGITATQQSNPYHIYTSSGVFTVTLTVTDTAGCASVKTHTVSISPPPTSFFQASTPGCTNIPILFNDLSTLTNGQFTSWYWEFGDGSDTLINAPGNPDISHIYIAAGNFVVKLKVNTSQGCEASSQLTITISASPLSEFSFENTCAAAPVNFTSQATPNGGTSIIGYLWNFGDPSSGINNTSNLQNPAHIYATAGTYTVILQVTNADACPDTVSHTVTILAKPGVDYSWANTCLGTTTQFTVNTATTNVPAVQTFDWDFGDGTAHSSQQDPTHAYTVTGNFTVILSITDTAGCMNQKQYSVTINPQPTALFSFTSGCLNTPVDFTDESFTSSGEQITNWHWDFGDPALTNDTSNVQNPSWTYSTLGIYNVTLTATSESGCTDTLQIPVQVFGLPTPNYTYTAAPCNNGAVYFQDSSSSQQATIVSWLWEFEPNSFSTLQNPVYVFYASDSCYPVKLTVTDNRGCKSSVIDTVCVPAQLTANFLAPPTCLLDTTYFTSHLITPTGDSLVFFNWNFGEPTSGLNNTSTLRNPSHYYSLPGIYTVLMLATDIHNCSYQTNQTVTINPLPLPQFTYTNGLCDSTIKFEETSTGSGSPITQWIWEYGDGTMDTIYSAINADTAHQYVNPGIYTVKLTVINGNGCSQFVTDSVLVKPCIKAEFDTVNTPLLCQYYDIKFADSSYSGLPINSWYWDFGDGTDTTYSSQVNPLIHKYLVPGTYKVKMLITTSVSGKSISDSTSMNVKVIASPQADYSVDRNCFKDPAKFTNLSNTNGVPISGYRWDFGDLASGTSDTTSILKSPEHTFTTPGFYTIQLIAKNISNCEDTIKKQIQVQPLPTADFSNKLACAGDQTEFIDKSDSVVAPLQFWNWSFFGKDGILGYRTDENPTFTFVVPGKYLVNLQVIDTNGCISNKSDSITVNEIPTSIFSYNENYMDMQGHLQFVNSSPPSSTKFFWDFGNGETSYAREPLVYYETDGTYKITLVTWNDLNCSDTISQDYVFMVKGLYIPNAFSPNNPHEEVRLFKPVGVNLDTYRIDVYDRWGNALWHSDKIDAAGHPVEGWDGKFNGATVQEGVYVWKASAVFKDGTIWSDENIGKMDPLVKSVYGTVTLVK
ncbi:MAG: PKD domain-containing protein [Bacteroidetes bacterium]|nr:PKD domain-containing protein [Bacteroidota bacterium]